MASDIEKLLRLQPWRNQKRSVSTSRRIHRTRPQPHLPELTSKHSTRTFDFTTPRSEQVTPRVQALRSSLANPQTAVIRRILRAKQPGFPLLLRLAVPYHALFDALAADSRKRSKPSVLLPTFPKAPFGKHRGIDYNAVNFREVSSVRYLYSEDEKRINLLLENFGRKRIHRRKEASKENLSHLANK